MLYLRENKKRKTMLEIYHITTKEVWHKAVDKGVYDFCALKEDGFIHCSTWEQVLVTANNYFKGSEDLLLLKIHTPDIKAEIKFENLIGGENQFPHIYGVIDLAAVTGFYSFNKTNTGQFIEVTPLEN